jgi:hypothetical protein
MRVIHTFVVNAETSAEVSLKQIRKLAMTGGVDIELSKGLSDSELKGVLEQWLPQLGKYNAGTSAYRSCTAYRVLLLVNQSYEYSKAARESEGFRDFLLENGLDSE